MTVSDLAARLKLDFTERRIVMLYYAEGLNIEEIAICLDLTRFRVASIHRAIVARASDEIQHELQAAKPK